MAAPSKSRSVAGPPKRTAAPKAASPAVKATPKQAVVNQAEIDNLTVELSEMKTNVDGLEKERDFYFGKLRDIEVLCQEEGAAGTTLSDKILQILYATEDGFAPPEEEAEVVDGEPEEF